MPRPGLRILMTIRAFLRLRKVRREDKKAYPQCNKCYKARWDSNSGLPKVPVLHYSQLNKWILRPRRNHKFNTEQQDFLLPPVSHLTDISPQTSVGISVKTTSSMPEPGASSRLPL